MEYTDMFDRFRGVLTSDTAPVVKDSRLLMDEDRGVQIFYAPFEYINPSARLVLVGITPGPTQMFNANLAARKALLAGKTSFEAIQIAKEQAAFSGKVMRSNLNKQMNHWGIHQWLGLANSSDLFDSAIHLLQTTSLIRYPTFVDGKDYRGSPDMTKHPLLRTHLIGGFADEIKRLQDALFVPLGPAVQKVMDWLTAEGLIDSRRITRGLLHPSPNCTYRIDYLIGDRLQPVPHATNPIPYDTGRTAFRNQYL